MIETSALVALLAIAVWLLFGLLLWCLASRAATRFAEADRALVASVRNGESGANARVASDDVSDELAVRSMRRALRRRRRLVRRDGDESLAIAFQALGFQLSSGQRILRRVSGKIVPGRLTAIMGPSGSGKTTFLNVLSGRAQGGKLFGSVLVNDLPDTIERHKKNIGFVPQEDATLVPTLTVFETLLLSATTRLPRAVDEFERLEIVETTLDMLDLAEQRYVHAARLSGGQQRRLSLGVELVARPLALLLDEPTSGLDATVAKHLVRTLRRLAATGMTIASVIHQPRFEVFELFDDVLLLAKGGETVYVGAVAHLAEYFAALGFHCPPRVNPADFYLDVVSNDVAPSDETLARRALAEARWRRQHRGVAAADPVVDEAAVGALAAALTARELAPTSLLTELWLLRHGEGSGGGGGGAQRALVGAGNINASVATKGSRDASTANAGDNSNDNDDDEDELRAALAAMRIGRPLGTKTALVAWLIVCSVVPWLLALLLFRNETSTTLAARRRALRARIAHRQASRDHSDAALDDDFDDDDDVDYAGSMRDLRGGGGGTAQATSDAHDDGVPRVVSKRDSLTQFVETSLRARFGAMIGVCNFMIIIGILLIVDVNRVTTSIEGTALIVAGALALLLVLVGYYDSIVRGSRRKATLLANVLLGCVSGPLAVLAVMIVPSSALSQKARAALVVGAMFSLMLIILNLPAALGVSFSATTIWLLVCGGSLLLAMIVNALLRYNALPHYERETAGFLSQVLSHSYRALLQVVRNPLGILLDLGLVASAGIFLGLVFYQQKYRGPILTPFGVEVGVSFRCPTQLEEYFPPACALLLVPMNNPLPAESSLSGLALSLAALSSSNRVFGDDIQLFRRESRTGIDTAAFFVGKQLAQIPLMLAAAGVFLFTFGGLASLSGNWIAHYVLLCGIYATASALAYAVSVIVKRDLSQLVGVVLLLIFMMFSGANPTLLQLQSNALLGSLLYYPSFLSFLRFSQELFYLIEIDGYHTGQVSMAALFGYFESDWIVCWVALFCFCFMFRLLAFVSLVVLETQGSTSSSGTAYAIGERVRGVAQRMGRAASTLTRRCRAWLRHE